MPWYYEPQSGGQKITPRMQATVRSKVSAYEQQRPWYPETKLVLKFRGQFCYVASIGKDSIPMPLGRLRHFAENNWSLAYFTYSREQYEPCFLANGQQSGPIEEALVVCETSI